MWPKYDNFCFLIRFKSCGTTTTTTTTTTISADVTGGRGSSVGKDPTPGEEIPSSIPAVATRSLLVGSVSV